MWARAWELGSTRGYVGVCQHGSAVNNLPTIACTVIVLSQILTMIVVAVRRIFLVLAARLRATALAKGKLGDHTGKDYPLCRTGLPNVSSADSKCQLVNAVITSMRRRYKIAHIEMNRSIREGLWTIPGRERTGFYVYLAESARIILCACFVWFLF